MCTYVRHVLSCAIMSTLRADQTDFPFLLPRPHDESVGECCITFEFINDAELGGYEKMPAT